MPKKDDELPPDQLPSGDELPESQEEEPWNPGEIEKADEEYQDELRKISEEHMRRKPKPLQQPFTPAPQAQEPEQPTPAQTSKPEADQKAIEQKEQGATVPIGSIRPQPPNAVKEEGSVIVARELAGQLGTSPEIKADMRIDERKMSVLTDQTLAALSHFSYRYVYDGVRYWGHITEWWLTGSQGINGLARKHVLQALANTSGVQVLEKAEKPNVIARNIWNRTWRKKAEDEGKVVEG